MRTAELADVAGVRASTIRFYERQGLLPPPERDANGYRCWTTADARRVSFLRNGQLLGFTLSELGLFLSREGGPVSGADVDEAIARKSAQLDVLIDGLQHTRAALAVIAGRHCAEPKCPLVETVAGLDVTALDDLRH